VFAGYRYISSFTNSFFPLAQVKKAAKRDKSGRLKKWLIRKSWLLFMFAQGQEKPEKLAKVMKS